MLFVLDKCAPGEIVDILVSFKQTNTEFHGFQITAQDSYYGNRLVGTFINVGDDEDTQVESRWEVCDPYEKGDSAEILACKMAGAFFRLFCGQSGRFYAMGIEANNDDTPMGDYIYKATRLIVVEPKKAKKGKFR